MNPLINVEHPVRSEANEHARAFIEPYLTGVIPSHQLPDVRTTLVMLVSHDEGRIEEGMYPRLAGYRLFISLPEGTPDTTYALANDRVPKTYLSGDIAYSVTIEPESETNKRFARAN